MTTDITPMSSPTSDEPGASRRDFVTAAVTVAAVAGAAGTAQAQSQPMLRFSNPPGMSNPPTYSHVVEVTGPHRTIYLAGQTGVDAVANPPRVFALRPCRYLRISRPPSRRSAAASNTSSSSPAT